MSHDCHVTHDIFIHKSLICVVLEFIFTIDDLHDYQSPYVCTCRADLQHNVLFTHVPTSLYDNTYSKTLHHL